MPYMPKYFEIDFTHVQVNNSQIFHENIQSKCNSFILPIMYEYEIDGKIILGHRGTATKLKHQGKYYIVTAKHVIDGNGKDEKIDIENIRLPVNTKDEGRKVKEVFRPEYTHRPTGVKINGIKDEELSDIIIIELNAEHARSHDNLFFDLKKINNSSEWDHAFLVGIPTTERDYNFVNKALHFTYISAIAIKQKQMGNLLSASVNNLKLVPKDADGYSGGSLFSIQTIKNSILLYGGMIIRGGNHKFHLIPPQIIKGHIESICY